MICVRIVAQGRSMRLSIVLVQDSLQENLRPIDNLRSFHSANSMRKTIKLVIPHRPFVKNVQIIKTKDAPIKCVLLAVQFRQSGSTAHTTMRAFTRDLFVHCNDQIFLCYSLLFQQGIFYTSQEKCFRQSLKCISNSDMKLLSVAMIGFDQSPILPSPGTC